MTEEKLLLLTKQARRVRNLALDGIYAAQSGHPGGSLSAADVITYLYFDKMNVYPNNPAAENRDRFVLSKGHCCPSLYAALALRGFFDVSELYSLRKLGAMLQGHPDMKTIPGIDMSTGSLGQGVSAACGIAAELKRKHNPARVYCMTGDGESEEGQVWEAAMFAAHYKLDNLTLFLDFNCLQIDGDVRKVMNPIPLDEKYQAFGWHTAVIDGHDFAEIEKAVLEAEAVKDKPSVIICRTVKGKGVSYMENAAEWHGKAPGEELYNTAKAELA